MRRRDDRGSPRMTHRPHGLFAAVTGGRQRFRRHPIMKYPVVTALSRLRLSTIILVFVIASLGASAGIGALFTATSRPRQPFGFAFRSAIANAWSPGNQLELPNQSVWFYSIAVLDSFIGVVLPALLLGAFVYKLLQHD